MKPLAERLHTFNDFLRGQIRCQRRHRITTWREDARGRDRGRFVSCVTPNTQSSEHMTCQPKHVEQPHRDLSSPLAFRTNDKPEASRRDASSPPSETSINNGGGNNRCHSHFQTLLNKNKLKKSTASLHSSKYHKAPPPPLTAAPHQFRALILMYYHCVSCIVAQYMDRLLCNSGPRTSPQLTCMCTAWRQHRDLADLKERAAPRPVTTAKSSSLYEPVTSSRRGHAHVSSISP